MGTFRIFDHVTARGGFGASVKATNSAVRDTMEVHSQRSIVCCVAGGLQLPTKSQMLRYMHHLGPRVLLHKSV